MAHSFTPAAKTFITESIAGKVTDAATIQLLGVPIAVSGVAKTIQELHADGFTEQEILDRLPEIGALMLEGGPEKHSGIKDKLKKDKKAGHGAKKFW